MAQTGFEKATKKMFGDFGPAVKIAQPGAGERLSREERDRMREDAEQSEKKEAEEQRQQERKEVIQTLVEMKVIPAQEEPAKPSEPEPVVEEKQGRGRPLKNPDVTDYVLMNFRVSAEFRQRIKMMAAEQARSVTDVFEEAFSLLFEKYPSK